jgi:hypothetical protein
VVECESLKRSEGTRKKKKMGRDIVMNVLCFFLKENGRDKVKQQEEVL